MNPNVLMAIAVTAEMTGTELSEAALRVMAGDLSAYPEAVAVRALDRCRKELKTRLTLAAVLERIEEVDGRPGAEEAWATALTARDESVTVVWTEETAEAYGLAAPLLDAGDKVGARMAFKEAYERITRESREAGAQPKWFASLGSDPTQREGALMRAAEQGRITQQFAAALLPTPKASTAVTALLEGRAQALLAAPDLNAEQRETNRRGIVALNAHLEQIERSRASVAHD